MRGACPLVHARMHAAGGGRRRYSRPTPSKRQNIELLVGWLDALIRGDEQAVAAALHPDVVWRGLRPEWGCAGAASVAATFMDARGAQADIDSIELIGAEHHAIMRVCWPQILHEEGRDFLTGVYNVFAIADRRITRIDDHADRAAALAAAGIGG
ncbi:MAG: hypothetical protein QOI73_2547 [Solirubrobacteraceae bacterium]|nr:hypothetical protein [Solirubrobacteraceae bacterium]